MPTKKNNTTIAGVLEMKKNNNNHETDNYMKELERLKNILSELSGRIEKCEKNIPEETKIAESLVRGLAHLKGKYKEYEKIYNDIVTKTSTISGLTKSAEEDTTKLHDIKDKIQEISSQADEIKEAIEANPDIIKDIENMNNQITNVSTLYSQAEKDKKEIRKLYQILFGYDITNKETGEIEHKEGLKQQLDATYDKLVSQMATLEKNTKQNFENTIEGWTEQYNAIKDKVENLLPGAMSTGLAEAYKAKRETEEEAYNSGSSKFIWMIGILAAIAGIPTIVTIALIFCKDIAVGTAIGNASRLALMLTPVCAALIWLGVFQNKNLKTSKKLIEEYSHKEATAKTYAGLAKQVSEVGDDEMSQKLKIKLLEQTLDAAAKNPSDCITNHEKSDNPMMALLNVSAKWVSRAGGAENVAKLLTAAAEIYANVGKQKSEDVCNLENDSEKE